MPGDEYDSMTSRKYDYEHSECGEPIRIENAVTADGEFWCPNPDCKKWVQASENTVQERGA